MLFDEVNPNIESKINKKLSEKSPKRRLQDGFDNNKVINQVLDKKTIMTLYKMINSHVISYVNGSVKAGKESLVFWAVDDKGNDIALKIYLVSTSNFKKRSSYIIGDPRFSKIKKGTRNLVHIWAQKEFRNLRHAYDAGIPVVRPIHVSNNVLAMEFIGTNGVPNLLLLESEVDENDYQDAIMIIKNLYKKAKLVHGDFSEYNLFKTDKGLLAFDFGSAVDVAHPNSKEFLKRDINNISKFFLKRGIDVEDVSKTLDDVIS